MTTAARQVTEREPLAGTPSSFEAAYREHVSRVARWAAHLGGPGLDAEDVVQEVFLVLSRKWSSFRRDGNLVSWLFQITRKITANQRRRLRWRRLWTAAAELAWEPSDNHDPEDDLDRRRMMVLFHRTLDRLPEKQRTVFVLYELEGLSTPAIAELVRRKLSTVKVQLARARRQFLASFRRQLRRQCVKEEIGLFQLARKIVEGDAHPVHRLGEKT